MGGHFWQASLFKGPKGGYPPKIFKYFLDILFLNTYIGIVTMENFNIFNCQAAKTPPHDIEYSPPGSNRWSETPIVIGLNSSFYVTVKFKKIYCSMCIGLILMVLASKKSRIFKQQNVETGSFSTYVSEFCFDSRSNNFKASFLIRPYIYVIKK